VLFAEMPAHAVEERETCHEDGLKGNPAVVDLPRFVKRRVGGYCLDRGVVDVLERVLVVAEVCEKRAGSPYAEFCVGV
jgi:hypothetical protein